MSFLLLNRRTEVMPRENQREDLLAEIAKRSGERKHQVQTLLEQYIEEQDQTREDPFPIPAEDETAPSFRGVLEEVQPAMVSARPQRRWVVRSQTMPAGTAADTVEKAGGTSGEVAELRERLERLEASQKAMAGVIQTLVQIVQEKTAR